MSGTKKLKPNLPIDWIVLNSKSFPDRIYYFNVRTGKSAWTNPSDEAMDKVAAGQSQNRKKRKKPDEDNDGPPQRGTARPARSDSEVASPANRPKLSAKRLSEPAKPTDTPQMRSLREKLLQRQAKIENCKKHTRTIVSKLSVRRPQSAASSKTFGCTTSKHALDSPVQSPVSPPDPHTPKTTQSKAQSGALEEGDLPATTQKALSSPREMRAQKTVTCSTDHTRRESSTGTGSRASKSKSIPRSVSETDGEETRQSLSKSLTPKSVTDKSGSSPVSLTKTAARKNTANKRLESIRKSLGAENKKAERIATGNTLEKRVRSPQFVKNSETRALLFVELEVAANRKRISTGDGNSSLSSAAEHVEPCKLPSQAYKNTESRLRGLQDRLSTLQRSPAKVSKIQSAPRRGKKQNKDFVKERSTTVANLIEQCKKELYHEDMDWEPIDEEKIITEIQEVRVQLDGNQSFYNQILNNSRGNVFELSQTHQPANDQKLYVVVDTNVFLSNLKIIEEIRDSTFKNYNRPIIVVPWTVLQELDYIKDNKGRTKPTALELKARKAVNFLHQHFSAKHPRVKGQTAMDANANKAKFATECPDDGILQSCLQIRETGSTVILLSYDKNLCNKAMVHELTTLERDDSIGKIDQVVLSGSSKKSQDNWEQRAKMTVQNDEDSSFANKELEISDDIFSELKAVIKHFLSTIVAKEMENLYGELDWQKYAIVTPPWSVTDVLKCAVKHWIAAVGDAFNRRAEPLTKELLDIFINSYKYCRKLKDVNGVLEKCNDLVQMVDPDKYQDLMIQSANSIKELQVNCRQATRDLTEEKCQEGMDRENDNLSAAGRADSAFQYFHEIWAFTSNFCGLAADMMGIPHTIPYERPNTIPSLENIKQMQPGIAGSLNRLLCALKTVLEEADNLHPGHRALIILNHALLNFLPDHSLSRSLKPLNSVDLMCCVREKKDLLKTGLCQLQELNGYICQMADLNVA